jgi:hypothetical protein
MNGSNSLSGMLTKATSDARDGIATIFEYSIDVFNSQILVVEEAEGSVVA